MLKMTFVPKWTLSILGVRFTWDESSLLLQLVLSMSKRAPITKITLPIHPILTYLGLELRLELILVTSRFNSSKRLEFDRIVIETCCCEGHPAIF